MNNIYGTSYIKSEKAHRLNYSGTMTRTEALAELDRLNAKPQQAEPVDFDRGFGIGGLKRHVESPAVSYKRGQICSICGSAESDGAMFTTGANGSICDDCF